MNNMDIDNFIGQHDDFGDYLNSFYYKNKDYTGLYNHVKNVDNRIGFERWLFNNFPTDLDLNTNYSNLIWHSKVVSLLCSEIAKDATASKEQIAEEDCLLTNIITQAVPLPPLEAQTQNAVIKSSARKALNLFSMIYNLEQVYRDLRDLKHPFSSKATLTRLSESESGLHSIILTAINDNDIHLLNQLAKGDPEGFKKAVGKVDPFGQTAISFAAILGRDGPLKIMAATAPQHFQNAMKVQDYEGCTPFHRAVKSQNLECVKIFTGEGCSQAFKMQDSLGKTPFHYAVEDNMLPISYFLLSIFANELNEVLPMQDQHGNTPLHCALRNYNDEIPKACAFTAAQGFKAALPKLGSGGWNILHLATGLNRLEFVKWLAERFPEEFKILLRSIDSIGSTPIHTAATFGHVEMMKYLIEKDQQGLYTLTYDGYSALSLVEKFRPHSYKEMTQFFKDNKCLKRIHKELFRRQAITHAWHIPQTFFPSSLVLARTGESMAKLESTGYRPYSWFDMMAKNLDQFVQSYPHLLTSNQIVLLKQVFDVGANWNSYPVEKLLGRIKAGLPIMIPGGFATHSINYFIWGNQLVVCNRGALSRTPIEVYHFNSANLEIADLINIDHCSRYSDENTYINLFNSLSVKLQFCQTPLDFVFTESCPLPPHSVNVCSFVSVVTAVYAFLLLGIVKGIDMEGRLIESKDPSPSIDWNELQMKAIQAIDTYRIWLSNEQIATLESNIKPLEKKDRTFEPDHRLILDAMRKAYLLPLDSLCEQKLERLTSIYLAALNPKDSVQLKSDIAYWKTLGRIVLV